MRQLTPGVKRLGIEFDHVNLDFRRQLEAALAGVEFVDIGKPSMWMRAIKSAEARMIGEEFVGATATIYFETGDGQEIRIQKSHEELADLSLAVGRAFTCPGRPTMGIWCRNRPGRAVSRPLAGAPVRYVHAASYGLFHTGRLWSGQITTPARDPSQIASEGRENRARPSSSPTPERSSPSRTGCAGTA